MSNAVMDSPGDDHNHYSGNTDFDNDTIIVPEPDQLVLPVDDKVEEPKAEPVKYKPQRAFNTVTSWIVFITNTFLVVSETGSLIVRHALVRKPAHTLTFWALTAYVSLLFVWIISGVFIKTWNSQKITIYAILSVTLSVSFAWYIGYSYL